MRWVHISNELVDVPLMLSSTIDGERCGTGFLCSYPFVHPQDTYPELVHVYVVTALHCVMNMDTAKFRELVAEFHWMEDQSAEIPLSSKNWVRFEAHEIPRGQDWVDLAVQPLQGGGYTGVIIGRSLRCVPFERLLKDAQVSDQIDGVPIGSELVTLGLFAFYQGSKEHIEPIARFGRLAMIPRESVRGFANNLMRAYLIESHASSGMSGSPVFIDSRTRDMPLLGVHVGHVPSSSTSEERFIDPSGVSLVVPSDLLVQLLETERLARQRARVEEEYRLHPWRFIDRRHRERRGVAFDEEEFSNMADYLDENTRMFRYRFLKTYSYIEREDVVDNWNECEVQPLGFQDDIRERFSGLAGEASLHLDLCEFSSVGDVESLVLESDSLISPESLKLHAENIGATHVIDVYRDRIVYL